jgi:hypothetical protein
MAARNGTRCTACISLQSDSITGSPRWASTGAWPFPGKCLAQADTPADCSPAIRAAPSRATSAGSFPYDRMPMFGL